MTIVNKVLHTLACCCLAYAGNAAAADLVVRVTEIRENAGHLMLSITDSAEGWDGTAKPIAAQREAASGKEAIFRFTDLAPGAYAAQVMHDENDNGSLDANVLGMPTEGYGFSRNPQVMRKATFEEARFDLAASGGEIVIELR